MAALASKFHGMNATLAFVLFEYPENAFSGIFGLLLL